MTIAVVPKFQVNSMAEAEKRNFVTIAVYFTCHYYELFFWHRVEPRASHILCTP